MISELEYKAVQESYGRLIANGAFFKRFYELFIGSSRDVALKLKNTNLAKQAPLLEQSISMALLFSQKNVVSKQTMNRLRESHNREHLDIPPELYDFWINNLIKAAEELDPEFSPELEKIWRKALQLSMDYIIAGY